MHFSMRKGQRGWNGQPSGGRSRSGGEPGMVTSSLPRSASSRGMAPLACRRMPPPAGSSPSILWGSVIEHGFPAQGWGHFRQVLALGGNVRKASAAKKRTRLILFLKCYLTFSCPGAAGVGQCPSCGFL